nr:hypothetical protein Iba_chr11bCG6000 [Ipomoea batatas]
MRLNAVASLVRVDEEAMFAMSTGSKGEMESKLEIVNVIIKTTSVKVSAVIIVHHGYRIDSEISGGGGAACGDVERAMRREGEEED